MAGTDVRVRIDRAALRRAETDRNGPLAAAARSRAVRVAAIARTITRSRRVARAIRVVPGRGVSYNVVARDVPFAIFEHEDTKPHTIRAKKAHGLLVFEIGGETVFTRKPVRHPGTKGSHWGDKALERVGLRVRRGSIGRSGLTI